MQSILTTTKEQEMELFGIAFDTTVERTVVRVKTTDRKDELIRKQRAYFEAERRLRDARRRHHQRNAPATQTTLHAREIDYAEAEAAYVRVINAG
jgi:hypothetical protein